MQSPRRADSKEITEAILGAAAALAREGIDKVSTNAIARRAGVGVASVYRYFPTKEAIFAELARRQHRALLLRLEQALRPGIRLEEALRRCAIALSVLSEQDAEMRRTLNIDVPLRWSLGVAREVHESIFQVLASWMRANVEPLTPDLDTKIFMLVGAARGVMALRLVEPERAPNDERLIDELAALGAWLLRAKR